MKTFRAILPLSLFMLASCAPAKAIRQHQTAPPAVTLAKTATSPVIAPPAQVEPVAAQTVTNFESMGAAIKHIFASEQNIQVIAFGEIHKSKASNLTPTLDHFAHEVPPVLADNNILDVVWEHIFSGKATQEEIAAFNKIQKLGPVLSQWLAYHPDYCGVIEMLRQADALGISLHGCRASDQEEYLGHLANPGTLIQKQALAAILGLLGQGKQVAVYTGAIHNDIEPLAGEGLKSFGQALRSKLGSGYVEVDIYLPELIPNVDAAYLKLDNWEALAPEKGVNLVNLHNGRYVLILPRFSEPVVFEIPDKAPVCPVD
ncbi:hypothetical protein ACFL37_01580 [Candidatus Margulisiibacteriota bacterium]